jgi:tetratricopeptide (TPR) repeat protein
VAVAPAAARADEADEAYARRTDLASARKARDLWIEAARRDPSNFDVLWKIARADYWLGGHAPEAERRACFEQGIDAGRKAAAMKPDRPEGHFWIAANMGALAESYGVRQGIKYRNPIKASLETVLRIDPSFQEGSADRALGRWYYKVPRLFGGNKKLAEAHLRKSLTYNPNSTASHFFLAELLLDDDQKPEGRAELEAVIAAPPNPDWLPEDREFKEKARRALEAKENR